LNAPNYQPGAEYAAQMDQADPLASFRERFFLPKAGAGEECVYLCGHSLGLQPKSAKSFIDQELKDWAELGVEGHFHGRHPWMPYHRLLRDQAAVLVGAEVPSLAGISVPVWRLADTAAPAREREPPGPADGASQVGEAITLAFCWSHVRRRFYELAAAGPAPIASEALERIAGLYAVEKDIRGRSADERRAMRQDRSRPIVDELEPWLRAKLALISQKTKLAEAIRYALSRWDGLSRFLDDGCIEIDSNVVERSIRPIALNRKNALFAGSDGGGEHWAVIASLIETCKLNGVEPQTYLTDVISKIVNGHPNSRIDELLPWYLVLSLQTQSSQAA